MSEPKNETGVIYNSAPPGECAGPGPVPADALMRRQRLVDEVRQTWLLEHEWHGMAEPTCPICAAGHMVHDHGAEDGSGLACRERRTEAGLLRGECLIAEVHRLRSSSGQRAESAATSTDA